MLKFLTFAVLSAILIASGCAGAKEQEASGVDAAITTCTATCDDALIEGVNLSNGPCLLDPIENLTDWVCDVVHSPRVAVDNLQENQCATFRSGTANHFVEVNETCDFIRTG